MSNEIKDWVPSAPVGVEGLIETWRHDIAARIGPVSKADLRPQRFLRDLEALAQQPATCETCGGRGEVGGLTLGGYESHPCPECEEQQPAADPKLVFGLGEARALVGFFGGHNTAVVVQSLPEGRVTGDDDEPLPAGLYAWCDEYPEEGSMFLGPADTDTEEHDGTPGQQPAAVDEANIGRAFLTVLADPSVAWRDTGAQPFIDRVAALAQPQGASHE